MKIALAQLNYHIGNFEQNVSKIKSNIAKAKAAGVDLIVFAELAVCGYPPRDFLEFNDFIQLCTDSINDIAKDCVGIAAIVGSPSKNPNLEGKNLYNSAFFLADGKVKNVCNKSLLPNYDVFDEYRYFEPANRFETVDYKGFRIALTICEDLWNVDDDPMYPISPMNIIIHRKPHVIINIAASPFSYSHPEERENVLCKNTLKYKIPVFYVNHVGAQTELLFDGGSMVVNDKGGVVDELNYFEEDFRIYDAGEVIDNDVLPTHEIGNAKLNDDIKFPRIYNALVMGIRNYFNKLGFKKAIIGSSGGIDSAVVLALAVDALGNDHVHAIMMPSEFSSDHSVNDAILLAENLGIKKDIIPINSIYTTFLGALQPIFGDLPFDLTEENIQARSRGVLLMAMSNKMGYILLNTSNKSELAVGYGTLYGDMCGGLSVIGDVYKTEVYELANYINRDKIIIPENIISKPPSAELRPDQKDSDSLPDYSILDKILFEYIEKRKGPKEIIGIGFDETLVRKILKMVNSNEYKRYQTPPILRISPKAFGMGRRLPIVAKYLS
ncbi:MAG: NAD+ synthase [Bacteroidota bacterium]